MTAEVHIVLKEAENALIVPSAALGAPRPDGRRTVKVLDDKRRQQNREVEVGIDDHVDAQILSGLALGDRVLIDSGSTP